jgi:hypothetical protein
VGVLRFRDGRVINRKRIDRLLRTQQWLSINAA